MSIQSTTLDREIAGLETEIRTITQELNTLIKEIKKSKGFKDSKFKHKLALEKRKKKLFEELREKKEFRDNNRVGVELSEKYPVVMAFTLPWNTVRTKMMSVVRTNPDVQTDEFEGILLAGPRQWLSDNSMEGEVRLTKGFYHIMMNDEDAIYLVGMKDPEQALLFKLAMELE